MDFKQVVDEGELNDFVLVKFMEILCQEPAGHCQGVAVLGVCLVPVEICRMPHATLDGVELEYKPLKFKEPVDIRFSLQLYVFHLVELYSMQVDIEPGNYVVAVSGGVDSVVLLDMLRGRPGLELVIAHYDHGIRSDSAQDRLLVERLAQSYKLPFVYEEGRLGPGASEATARQARYAFLERVRQEHNAVAIITAHQQDDVLETAILNILRGTGRKGLTSLASTPHILRPMLDIPKQQLIAYARSRGLQWREDSTNTDERYLRNYIRHRLLSRFDEAARAQLAAIVERMRLLNKEIDVQILALLQAQPGVPDIGRRWFIQLPHAVAKELLASWLRGHGIRNFDTKTLERLTVAGKTLRPGAVIDVVGGVSIRVGADKLALIHHER